MNISHRLFLPHKFHRKKREKRTHTHKLVRYLRAIRQEKETQGKEEVKDINF